MKFLLAFISVFGLLSYTGTAQSPAVQKLTKADLASRKITCKGEPQQILGWKDKNGENLIVLTETKELWDSKEENRSKELYALHYIQQAGAWKLSRQIYDFVKNCPFDVMLNFVPNSLTVTDQDKDGLGEVTFLYTLGCRSDVSPDDLKLMLLENGQKYAIRGNTILMVNGQISDDYNFTKPVKTFDPAFAKAPAALKEYASQQWEKFKIVKMGE
jgi:hypothetical protein